MSIFTRRHYEWLTAQLHDSVVAARTRQADAPFASAIILDFVVQPIADELERESPGFDRQLFMANILDSHEI